ncbi:hypothetical protein [Coleofasciculus sp. F4-SAH-05]|uniref:hypothetical protein n=1 Tax=Coleofasciculus sp. F4-SAH-05 TaxID=3069525 RepID=UPI0032FF6856
MSFVICHSSFVIRHSSFVIRHSSFVICHLSLSKGRPESIEWTRLLIDASGSPLHPLLSLPSFQT